MRVKAWNNGGQGYGIRVGAPNRDRYFSRAWTRIEVEIDGAFVEFPLTGGFWRNCPKFRGPRIGQWLREKGHATWHKGEPPEFELVPLGGCRFRLI